MPEWFGDPAVNEALIESISQLPAFVATSNGNVVGFITLQPYASASVAIHVIAVHREYHKQGIGHLLLERAQEWCGNEGKRWIYALTRGPSTPDPEYERTRSFYYAEGFDALYESLTEWGPKNAALVLIRAVDS